MPKLSTFSDNFTTADAAKWTYQGAAGVSGGQLQLVPAPTYGNKVDSAASWDLTSSTIHVELVSAPLGNGSIGSFVSLFDSGGSDSVQMYVEGGALTMTETVSGSPSSTNVSYNSTSHRWLRIRHDGTNVIWETAPEGITWTTRRTKVAGRSWASVNVQLQAGYFGTEPVPGVTVFDNLGIFQVVLADGASATDAATMTRLLTLSDTASQSEVLGAVVTVGPADGGAGTDTLTVLGRIVNRPNSGTVHRPYTGITSRP